MNIFVILCWIIFGSAGWIVGTELARKDKEYSVIFCGVIIVVVSTFLIGVVSNL